MYATLFWHSLKGHLLGTPTVVIGLVVVVSMGGYDGWVAAGRLGGASVVVLAVVVGGAVVVVGRLFNGSGLFQGERVVTFGGRRVVAGRTYCSQPISSLRSLQW